MLEDAQPLGRGRGLIQTEALENDLVVRDRDRDVDEPVAEPRPDREPRGVARRVELQRELVRAIPG